MKKRFDVRILGQELSVMSDSGDEHVEKVVRYVSGKMEEAGRNACGNSLDIAILAALNIADEYLKTMGAKENIHNQLENRVEQLISLINENK